MLINLEVYKFLQDNIEKYDIDKLVELLNEKFNNDKYDYNSVVETANKFFKLKNIDKQI
ncbi:MAG: hypothetical protein ACOC3X_03885 [Nanoarchaeota archaeon]